MAFPTSPSNGDEYTNALGTVYKYLTTDDKWYIINAPINLNDLAEKNHISLANVTAAQHQSAYLFTLSADSTVIQWQTDGAANNNYQDIDLDSYFTVPANTVAAALTMETRDGVLNLLYFGATETDLQNYVHYSQVINISMVENVSFCPLATGNILKFKCLNTVPTAFTRIFIKIVGWWTTT
ncbi:hypothetical protein LCGC14_0910820 [marine sediment metagenome]|uniref:Uncharacterized protein n=1 Tax=marine sediment metagenome TaxID=412755 RepID=A0A0F9PEG7_9ZZZZ